MARTVQGIRRAGGLVLAVTAASLAAAVSAGAQTGPPSAVDMYLEVVPTAGGPAVPGTGKSTAQLPKPGTDALKKASPETAGTLEDVATSSTYGAPLPRNTSKPERQAPVRDPDGISDASLHATLESAGAIVSSSATDARLLGLLVAVVLTTLGAVALAIGRTRSEGR